MAGPSSWAWRRIPVIKHPCADLLIVQLVGILAQSHQL